MKLFTHSKPKLELIYFMPDFGTIGWTAAFYEVFIFLIYIYYLVLTSRYYHFKRNDVTSILYYIFLFYGFAIFFSIISKFMNAIWGGVPYENQSEEIIWILGRLHAIRFGMIFFIMATIYSYKLKEKLFDYTPNRYSKMLVYVIGIIFMLLDILLYEFDPSTGRGNPIDELICYISTLIFTIMGFTSFFMKSRQTAKFISDPVYKNAILSLSHWALGIILVVISVVFDRAMLMLFNWAYSIFYFMMWIWALFAIHCAYKGFILPTNTGEIGKEFIKLKQSVDTLHQFWLIDRTSGIVIFSITFEDWPSQNEEEEMLMGGFFSAINALSNELIGEDVKILECKTVRILFNFDPNYCYVIMTKSSQNPKKAEESLRDIQKVFEKMKSNEDIAKFNNNLSVYKEIKNEIEVAAGKQSIRINYYDGKEILSEKEASMKAKLDSMLELFKNQAKKIW